MIAWEEREKNAAMSVCSLAELLHISIGLLYKLSNQADHFYQVTQITGKNGKIRTIEAPQGILKLVQRRILRRILVAEKPSGAATAFFRGAGIKNNAAVHIGQKVLIHLDFKDFFPSLRASLLLEFFEGRGFCRQLSVILTKLCTFRGHLPQGAPCSPHLSNVLLNEFDAELSEYCVCRQIHYSRYADDLTFSGALSESEITEVIDLCRISSGKLNLKLNRRKTGVFRVGARQIVTGLIVNDVLGVPRSIRRGLRQKMYYLNKHWEREFRQLGEGELNRLLGVANFIWSVRRENAEFAEYRRQLLEIQRFFHMESL